MMTIRELHTLLKNGTFHAGNATVTDNVECKGMTYPRFTNEFWTSKQRDAHSIHEISYRACFKPQLPRFFIERLTAPGDIVYDPFSGRGTTVLEAGLLGRRVIANDINPLSALLSRPRFFLPDMHALTSRLTEIAELPVIQTADIDIGMFYHHATMSELLRLRHYFLEKEKKDTLDHSDAWIRMVATNRLTGHSKGFFSVYTLPPNQAITAERQIKINARLNQVPEYRDVHAIIAKKSHSLLKKITTEDRTLLQQAGHTARFLTNDARNTESIADNSVALTVTSPPFLSVINYVSDNWLRCWFNGLNTEEIAKNISVVKKLTDWTAIMQDVFYELYRITLPGGWVAFEVGDVEKGTVHLDEYVVPLGCNAGFECAGILINSQEFTKTANIWGVGNNEKGTNTNRIVLLQKPL